MEIGVSTACLYPMESEKALKILLDMGYRHFEFFINATVEMQQPFLGEFKALLDAYGATVQSVHPFTSVMESTLFFGDYARRMEDGLGFYSRYCKTAAYLGARLLVLHGQRPHAGGNFSLSEQEYFARYLRIYKMCQTYGITLCQENVVGWRSGSAAFIDHMRCTLQEQCAFAFDIKQCLLQGESPAQMLDSMGNCLKHVHFSDRTKEKSCLLPGKGEYDLAAVAKKLHQQNYGGSVIIEVYASSYQDQTQLQEARFYTQTLFSQGGN